MAEKLKPYPYREFGGATEISAVRMLKMVAPYCPVESNPWRQTGKPGELEPNPHYTGEPNCQMAYKFNSFGRWDIAQCEKLGHEPYYFEQKSKIVENVTDAEGIITGQRERQLGDKRLNVVQVAHSIRIGTNSEVALAVAKGYRTLESFGYEAPCEYRNCWQPVKIKGSFGNYCNERHARLIAADRKKVTLPVLGGDPNMEEEQREQRDAILDGINIS